jgi:hypothetical protein
MPLAQRIYTRPNDCVFYADAGVTRVDLVVGWESFGGRTPYWQSGMLELAGTGEWTWTPAESNDNLRRVTADWEEVKLLGRAAGWAIGSLAAAASASGSAPEEGEWVACVWNESAITIRHRTRWVGDAGWTNDSIAPGRGLMYSNPSTSRFQISLDNTLTGPDAFPTYDLPATRSTTDPLECSSAGSFALRIGADTIGVWMR